MLNLNDLYEINHLARKGYSQREIARELGFSRKTVRKYMKQYQQDQQTLKDKNSTKQQRREAQERLTTDPKYHLTKVRRHKYTPEIDALLNKILADEEKKTRKQRLSCQQIHEMILAEGHQIGLTTITGKIREKRNKKGEVYIKQNYDYGDRVEFDYGETDLMIGGTKTRVYLAVFAAPASGYRMAYLYRNAKMQTFIDAHNHFFAEVGGVYETVVYDNMRNVVKRFIGPNQKELTDEAIRISRFYGFDVVLTNTRSGNEKGTVENAVRWVRNKSFALKQDFESFEQAQSFLKERLEIINKDCAIEEEKKQLKPYPGNYDYAQYTQRSVNKYSFIRVDNNDYSVPEGLVGKTVTVKIYPNEINVYYGSEHLVDWARVSGENKTCVDIHHYLHTLLKKPGALKNSYALKSVPQLKDIFDQYYTSDPRQFIVLLMDNKDIVDTDELVTILDPTKAARKQHNLVASRTQNEIEKIKEMFN